MFGSIKGIFSKFTGEEDETDVDDYSLILSYKSVPMTIALRKRRFEEEQTAKYGLHKDKSCDIQ